MGKIRRHRSERGKGEPCRWLARDYDILLALFIHGPLRTDMLSALLGCRWLTHTIRMSHLFNEPDSCIDRPFPQFEVMDANGKPLIHDINENGIRKLYENYKITRKHMDWYHAYKNKRDDWHEYGAAYVSASIELGARQAGKRFVPWTEILDNAPEATKKLKNPFSVTTPHGSVITDRLFGIESEDRFDFYWHEFDRATEGVDVKNADRSSWAQKRPKLLALYDQKDGEPLYKRHFGFTNMMVSTVTTSRSKCETIQEKLGSWPGAFIFKSYNLLDKKQYKPEASGHFFTEEWQRSTGKYSM